MAANYPTSTVTFGSDRVDLVSTVVANDVNSVYHEVVAIANDLGTGNMGSGTPGLKYSAAWGIGSFDSTTTTWTGLQARLQNIENGLYQAYTYRIDLTGKSGFNTVKSSDANTVGLTISQGKVTATSVTYASSDGTTVSYTSANKFTVGQKVSVTGLGVASGASLNLTLQTITALIGTSPNYTGFTVAAPTVTGVTGSTSGANTSLTVVGDVSKVVAGMTISGGSYISSGTKVSSISGQVVQMDRPSTGSVYGSITFSTIGTSSGTGAAVAYQTTNLQNWSQDSGTVVASISPDGNLTVAGNSSIGGNTTIGGTLTVTKAVTFSDAVSITGAVAISAGVIDGGTP